VTRANHPHGSGTRGALPRQIDVSKLQGKPIPGKLTCHHWFQRPRDLPGEGRRRVLDIATLNTEIREALWISILNRHYGAGDSPTPASALGGATQATD